MPTRWRLRVVPLLVAAGLAAGCTAHTAADPLPSSLRSTPPSTPPPLTPAAATPAQVSPSSVLPSSDVAQPSARTTPTTSGSPLPPPPPPPPTGPLRLVKTIYSHLDPKSVVSSGAGLFFAQNMMYLHTINVYDRDYKLVKIIPDTVRLSDFGYPQYRGTYKGAPVEAAFTPDGASAYISNYSMYGAAPFTREGADVCKPADHYPNSFVYRVNTTTLSVDQVIEVGAVPKYVAVTPDGKYVLVSNWCSYTESVIDIATGKEVRQIAVGAYPRGIAVDPSSSTAYIAVMGSTRIAVLDLRTFELSWIAGVGSAPRHLVISPDGRWLYATINGDGVVDKIDLTTRKVVRRVATGRAPRSMAISPDGGYLYVVNYMSNTMTKLRAADMGIVQTVATEKDPIGITYDNATHHVWVACYSGALMVFSDGA
ncbi:MAG TPA: YncE family protein [Acidothermaceae bacterium]|nr:YncE family protein [Acidothermaceae bacterium]